MTEKSRTIRTDTPSTLGPMLALTAGPMVSVNDVILEKMGSDVPLIPELAGHLIAAGGKRMRPMLTIMGALAGMQDSQHSRLPRAALYLAAAVEFIHNATLLHDDVIDNSDKRRGQDTANALWGNEASVLVGDFLFARAFELMVDTGDISVLGLLSSASARITEGEVKQMSMAGRPDSSLDDYLSVITNKTAILFAAAIEAGARVGGGSAACCAALHDYGLALGRAFQICDDALDYGSGLADMGKNAGDDFYDAKVTMPVILAWQAGSEDEHSFWQRTIGTHDYRQGDLEQARRILGRHSAVETALAAAREQAQTAVSALAPLGTGPLTDALCAAARFAAARAY